MNELLIIIILLINFILPLNSKLFIWRPDEISINNTIVNYIEPNYYQFNISIITNGIIDNNDNGHYRINFFIDSITKGLYTGSTVCIPIGINTNEMINILTSTFLYSKLSDCNISDIINIKLKRNYDNRNPIHIKTFYMFLLKGNDISTITVTTTESDCIKPQLIGNWNDFNRWYVNEVPGVDDDVIIPKGSGIIVLNNNIEINSLNISGGILVNHKSSCPWGWSSNPYDMNSYKCYRLYEEMLPFYEADHQCTLRAGGSMYSHLVELNDYQELDVIIRLCRGLTKSSNSRLFGCWIGMTFDPLTNSSEWIEPQVLSSISFRDWRRFALSQDYNLSISHCVQVYPWSEDPLIKEEGSYITTECQLLRPFVCQMAARTTRYIITIYNKPINSTIESFNHFSDGILQGGYMAIYGKSYFNEFTLDKSATLSLLSNRNIITYLYILDGSSINVYDSVSIDLNGYIGEMLSMNNNYNYSSLQGIQPLLNLYYNSSIKTITSPNYKSNVIINARVDVNGHIYVDDDVSLQLLQGGDLSKATVVSTNAFSTLELNGYGMKLSSFDSFELKLSSRGPVTEEYLDSVNAIHLYQKGIYKLLISTGNHSEITRCITYNASINLLTEILNEIGIINQRGGVTVRRYGDGQDSYYNYGFTYRIDIDAISTDIFTLSSVNISLYCFGITNCGCAFAKVPLFDSKLGVNTCPRQTNSSSTTNFNSCILEPNITITMLSSMSYTRTIGQGSIVIVDGIHRLPPVVNMSIVAYGGNVIVAANNISWSTLVTFKNSLVIITGGGWHAWDSANVLYIDNGVYDRNFDLSLDRIPSFLMSLSYFSINDLSGVVTASPRSNMTWIEGNWTGGIIGGRSTLSIVNYMNILGSSMSIRYDLTLWIHSTATLYWFCGNISLANAANIIIDGNLTINTINCLETPSIGESILLQSSNNKSIILSTEQGRLYDSYYDSITRLRGGWYPNPICGKNCLLTNKIVIRYYGNLFTTPYSNASFYLPLNLIDNSQVILAYASYINFASGGICGNNVIMDMSNDSIIQLSGGMFLLDQTCSLRGAGNLIVSGGYHDLAYSIDAQITISGGTMIWPNSRGPGGSITFKGGLTIRNNGTLQIQPLSTTLITKEVQLQDNCLIQFPTIGIAAQPGVSDLLDAPDKQPKGNFTVVGIMRFYGGTISGKVNINTLSVLVLNGTTKYIRSLAKLVNYGLTQWGTGDLITDSNGDFINLNDIQYLEGITSFTAGAYIRGTILPIEDGGDVFAVNYNSWDYDEGKLSYDEYIKLKLKYVSIVPDGWTEFLQTENDVESPL